MLERYYVKPETIDRIRASWLGGPIEQYVTWLAEQGYADRSVYRRVPMLMHFAEYSAARGANAREELPDHVEGFVEAWVHEHGRQCKNKEAKRRVEYADCPVHTAWQLSVGRLWFIWGSAPGSCARDEGGPLVAGLQDLAAKRLALRW